MAIDPLTAMMIAQTMGDLIPKADPVKAGGGQHLLGNRPYISLAPNNPQGYSLMTMPPIGYEAASSGNNIPAAVLDQGGSAPTDAMRMDRVNLAQMGNAPVKEPDTNPFEVPGQTQQRLPKTPEEMAHEVEIQKMEDKNALIRQGISSAGSLIGSLLRPPSAIAVGQARPNPNLQMFRRRRGLMGG